jgi:putative acetyltransferase
VGPAGLDLSEALPADLDAVLAVNRRAFGDESVPDLVRALAADPSARPSLSLVARDGDRVTGHILFTAARVSDAPPDVVAAILAPLAVVPEAQRTGIGGRLIAAGVDRLGAAGTGLVFVLGHPSYYPRHGFEPATRLGLAAPYSIDPDDAWMVRALRPGLLGAVRGVVACADAMARPEMWR